jgi:CBS domain-containing protein
MHTGKLLTVGPEMTVGRVLQVLLDNDVSGVPVVTPKGELAGIVSQRDILKRLRTLIDVGIARELFATEVRSVMQVDVKTVTPATDLSRVAATLRRSRIHRVPVVEHGRLVGIVTTSDFLRPLEAPELLARLFESHEAMEHWSPFRSVDEEVFPML